MTLPSLLSQQDDFEQLKSATPIDFGSLFIWKTEREREVLQLIIDGLNNLAVAQKLYITTGTVKTHVRNILKKLCVHDRTQAAILALRAGLVH